jgi:hypothetical protein
MLTAKTGADALSWVKDYADKQAPALAAASDESLRGMKTANTLSELQTQQVKDAIARQKDKLEPLQDELVAKAHDYGSLDNQNAAAGRATADVTQGFSTAREDNARALERSGVSLNDGVAAGQNTQLINAQALGIAGAATKARTDTRLMGDAKLSDAASMLSGLPGNAVASTGAALTASNNGVNASIAPITAGNTVASLVGSGYGTAINGSNASGNMFLNQAQANNQANAAAGSAIGSLAGAGLTAFAI